MDIDTSEEVLSLLQKMNIILRRPFKHIAFVTANDFRYIGQRDPDHFETPDKAHFETQRIRIISKHKSPG